MNSTTTSQLKLLTALYPTCVREATAVQNVVPSRKGRHDVSDDQSDFGALVYIVVVLVFYSAGVMVMIVRYLKTEKKELEEEATLENFFKYMPDRRRAQEDIVNRVAIHAFHTLTSISYEEDEADELELISVASSPDPLLITG
ncbi:unnamed protein product [Candidula unifasciata]|uniref:Uncharacterized protein n=1 Tax=Candidula unifasciata TaxID=100452 RepID=A0A8S4AAZ3_9EUPU|nr:unnamed protein product [Candidula unifasciata]CAG5136146.1 unnamed protein product [Candidula unifasciata]